MSNDIDAQTIQHTQQILTKYIKKPPLTEKLLQKPPFRFLHDIVNVIIRETGFLKGLYTERELVSENVKDKDDKIAFLNKLIEATKTITATELAVRATKVIAGLEPTETNLLLQTIGTALDKKLDSSQYVSQLKSQKKSKTHINAQESDRKTKPDKAKEKVTSKSRTKQDDKAKVASTPTSKSQKQNGEIKTSDRVKLNKRSTSKESVTSENKSKNQTQKTKTKTQTPREHTSKVKQGSVDLVDENVIPETINEVITSNEEVTLKLKEQNGEPDLIPPQLNGDVMQKPLQNELPHSMENIKIIPPKETPIERVKSAKPRSGSLKTEKDAFKPITAEPVKIGEFLQTEKSSIEKISRTENDSSQLTIPDVPKVSDSPQLDNHLEKPLNTVRPRSSLRPPSVRPSSARPGAPRLRNELSLPEGEVIPLGKVNVIVESFNNKEIDEEETVTIQAAPEPELQHPILQLPTDKGHLVEQILEQIHQDDVTVHAKSTVNIEWEQDGLRNRNAANKEIDQLKAAIQTLTRTANPLGKLVNYLHEDIEAMHSELDMWINSARQIMAEVTNQKRISDESHKPLQGQLEEIEDNITKHQQQIVSAYGNVLRNEQRIRDLLIK